MYFCVFLNNDFLWGGATRLASLVEMKDNSDTAKSFKDIDERIYSFSF